MNFIFKNNVYDLQFKYFDVVYNETKKTIECLKTVDWYDPNCKENYKDFYNGSGGPLGKWDKTTDQKNSCIQTIATIFNTNYRVTNKFGSLWEEGYSICDERKRWSKRSNRISAIIDLSNKSKMPKEFFDALFKTYKKYCKS